MSGKVIPSSSASDCLTEKISSPVKMKRDLSGERAKTTWQPKDKAPSSSSEDSEESSSSSDEDTGRNRRHAQVRTEEHSCFMSQTNLNDGVHLLSSGQIVDTLVIQ